MTTNPPAPNPAPDDVPAALSPARVLLGWLPASEGELWLAGRTRQRQATPEAIARGQRAREAVAARPAEVDQTDLCVPLPPELDGHIAALEAETSFAHRRRDIGTPMMVDLARVVAMQPHVFIGETSSEGTNPVPTSLPAIARLTLPATAGERVPATFDAERNVWILSSPNPNLSIIGNFNEPVGPGFIGFGFAVGIRPSYLQVVGIRGRYILRDGHHRAYRLLAAGVRHAPAFVKECDYLEATSRKPGLLPAEVFMGDRPPLLSDYADETVSAETRVPAPRRTIIVQALEFTSPG